MLKQLLLILFISISAHSFAQVDSLIDSFINKKIPLEKISKPSSTNKKDTSHTATIIHHKDSSNAGTLTISNDSPKKIIADSSRIAVDTTQIIVSDSLKKDSINFVANFSSSQIKKIFWQQDTNFTKLFKLSFFNAAINPVYRIKEERKPQSKDDLFYTLIGITLFLGILKVCFPKYFHNISRWFFQASFRIKQSKESLMYDRLASMLFNFLFILSGGLFISLLINYYKLFSFSFWALYLFSLLFLTVIYLFKFIFLKFIGFLFNVNAAANSYIFIVFLVNKIAGITLIPFLFLLAFSNYETVNNVIVIAYSVLILFLIYRYVMLLSYVRSNTKVSAFQIFLYLCVVEIIPVLIIYKVFFNKIINYINYHSNFF